MLTASIMRGVGAALLAVLFVMSILGCCIPVPAVPVSPTNPGPSPPINVPAAPVMAAPADRLGSGDQAVVDSEANYAIIAVDDRAFDELMRLSVAKDLAGFAKLLIDKRAIAEKNGVRVTVLDSAFQSVKVRVNDGEHPGFVGWTVRDFLRRSHDQRRPSMTHRERAPSPLLEPISPTDRVDPSFAEKERKAIEREKARMPSRKSINASVAASMLKSAQRVDGNGELDRALFLYKKIVQEFPATAEAKAAAKRLGEIER